MTSYPQNKKAMYGVLPFLDNLQEFLKADYFDSVFEGESAPSYCKAAWVQEIKSYCESISKQIENASKELK